MAASVRDRRAVRRGKLDKGSLSRGIGTSIDMSDERVNDVN